MCLLVGSTCLGQSAAIRGTVKCTNGALPYVNVAIIGTQFGAVTNGNGSFEIQGLPPGDHQLSISSIGYEVMTIPVALRPEQVLELGVIGLESQARDLEEFVVTGTMREVHRAESPIPVEVLTPKLFKKDPQPSLLGSIGMVNGVRPQLNCSVCNTGDIHINGMEGPYTLVLIDGMPIVSSLGTVYGLSGIPNSMVERIEVVKGPAGALYGSEAMGGIINVITRDPRNAPRLAADAFVTSWKEAMLDLSGTAKVGKMKGLVGLNTYQYNDPRDDTGDGFTDLTIQQRYSIFAKLDQERTKGRVASFAGRYLHEDRWGGEMNWTPQYAGSDSIYGESVATRRWEAIGQYELPIKERVLAQFSFNGHDQDSWYGVTRFTGQQEVAFGQIQWDKKIGPQHELLAGVAIRYTRYDDNTPGTADAAGANEPQSTPLPGVFLQDEWRFSTAHTLLVGYRLDHHPVHGLVQSPRVAFRWKLAPRKTLRASLGTGFRVVNLFTEDHAALTGSREVHITEDLRPERSVGATLNYNQSWSGTMHFWALDATAWYTHFTNQIIGDFDADPNSIIYANLNGHAVSRGASLNGEAVISGPWKAMAGFSWMEVYRVERSQEGRNERSQQFFAPEWSGTFTLGWKPNAWSVDLTGQWYGPMRLPVQPMDPRPEYSPWYALVNMQLTRSLPHGIELYGGVKNLLDFVPENSILRPEDPFDHNAGDPQDNPDGHTFDTTYMYAPLQGIRTFFGVRWIWN